MRANGRWFRARSVIPDATAVVCVLDRTDRKTGRLYKAIIRHNSTWGISRAAVSMASTPRPGVDATAKLAAALLLHIDDKAT